MNKPHGTDFCYAPKNNASRLSHADSTPNAFKSLSILATAICLALAASPVWSSCTGAGTDNVVCTGTLTQSTANHSTSVNGDPITVTANNWTMNGGHLYVVSSGSSKDINFTGNNINASGTSTVNGLIHVATVGEGNASVTVSNSGVDSLAHGSYKSSGLVTHATGTGSALTEVTGNVRVEVDSSGLLAVANGSTGKDATISMSGGNNVIVVTGSVGYGAQANAGNGKASVMLSGTNRITTTDNDSNAIHSAGASAVVTVDSDATLITHGDRSNGVYGIGNGQLTDIASNATITTSGNDSAGIRGEQAQVATTGDIIVKTDTSSNITTNGWQSEGIHAYLGSESAGGIASNGNVTVDAQGNITTNGSYLAEGIYGAITHSNATGDVNITFRGDKIETTGTSGGSGNRGILGSQLGSGNITVKHDGNMIKTAGNTAHGIEVRTGLNGTDGAKSSSVGDVKVGVTGTIETAGNNAHGIFVNAANNAASIEVINSGNVSVSGNDASAIRVSSSGGGDVLIRHEAGGVITSTGNNSVPNANQRTDAIYAYKNANTTGDILVVVNGDITTSGSNRASGAHASHFGTGNVTVMGSGNIKTTATNNNGTSIYSYGMAATVTDNGVGNAFVDYYTNIIETSADHSYALYAGVTGDGNATVVNNAGSLTTHGSNSHGIWSRNESLIAGNVYAANLYGDIITTGDGAHGIYAQSSLGDVDAQNIGGNITTSGVSADAIRATANGTGTVYVKNTGTLITHSDKSKGILVSGDVSQSGKIIVENEGDITTNSLIVPATYDERAHAIYVENKNSGDTDGILLVHKNGTITTMGGDPPVFVLKHQPNPEILN